MKKLALAAIAAVAATLSFTSVADAGPRGTGFEWRHHRGFHDGWRHGRWHDGWRHHGWRHGWRGRYWGPGYGYWGGPTIVIGPGYGNYCFVKKVRRYDQWGNMYIKRVRVCR